MKIIGWLGILHVAVVIVWMGINICFHMFNPVNQIQGESIAQIGMDFYSQFPGYLGFHHGSKALVMLLSVVLPIGLFMYLRGRKGFEVYNLIALITGCFGFMIYGVSLMLQAVTVEYAFHLYRVSEDPFAPLFAMYLYDWSMLKGGFSVSLYIIANLFLACWVIIHSRGMFISGTYQGIATLGLFVGILQAVGHLVSWFFLMQAKQNMHHINEAVGMLFMIWILIVGIRMIQGRIKLT